MVEGPRSGSLGRLDAHAATNNRLKVKFSNSETSNHLHLRTEWEALAIIRLMDPVFSC